MALTPRRRRWLYLAVITLGLFTWWWLSQPKPLVLVGRQVVARGVHSKVVLVREAGVIWRDDLHHTLNATRWDGTRLWTMDQGKLFPFSLTEFNFRSGFSPDLRTLASFYDTRTEAFHRSPCLRIWRDGRLCGSVRPFDSRSSQVLLVDNAGGIWCRTSTQLVRIEGGRIVARCPLPAARSDFDYTLSPDGGALLVRTKTGYTYYTMQVAGSTVQLHLAYTMNWRRTSLYLLARDVLLRADGARYNAQGQVTDADGWHYSYFDEALESSNFSGALVQIRDADARVLTPATGECWTLPHQESPVIITTPDGRYALSMPRWLSDGPLQRILTPLINRWSWLDSRWSRLRYSGSLTIYERPGRPRARAASWSTDLYTYRLPGITQSLNNIHLALSPDGHTLHVLAKVQEGNDTRLEILTYRW
ncbi:MAG: hypothetical protein ACYDBB_23155 [Armatimonadota bacterium]